MATILTANAIGRTLQDFTSEDCRFNARVDGVTMKVRPDGALEAVLPAGAALPVFMTTVTRVGDTLHAEYSNGTTQTTPLCCPAATV